MLFNFESFNKAHENRSIERVSRLVETHKDEIYKFGSLAQVNTAKSRYNELIRTSKRSPFEPRANKEKIEHISQKLYESTKLVALCVR